MRRDFNSSNNEMDIDQIKQELFKRLNVKSEKELMRKTLGTDDVRMAKRILRQRLGDPTASQLINMLQAKMGNSTESAMMAQDLNKALTPAQKRRLHRMLQRLK